MNLEQQNQNDSPVITASDFFLINASTLLDNNFKLVFFLNFSIFTTKYTSPQPSMFCQLQILRREACRLAMLPMVQEHVTVIIYATCFISPQEWH